jgi:hypothetical protein
MLPENRLNPNYAKKYKNVALSNTGQLVKTLGTELYSIHFGNTNASVVYLHLYDKATAPTTGTDVPVATYLIPASDEVYMPFDEPNYFTLGLGVSVSTGSADNDNTAPGTACVINLQYK